MRLEVPDEFWEMLVSSDNIDVVIGKVIKLLLWATENPTAASKIAEGWRHLGKRGKWYLLRDLFFTEYDDPCPLLIKAEGLEREEQRKEEYVRKFVAAINGGGYRFRLPSGAECLVKRRKDGSYDFVLTPGGERVVLCYSDLIQNSAVEIAKKMEGGEIERPTAIIYNNERYLPEEEAGQKILTAIKKNVSPGTFAILNS